MKRFFVFLTGLGIAFAAYGQDYYPGLSDYEYYDSVPPGNGAWGGSIPSDIAPQYNQNAYPGRAASPRQAQQPAYAQPQPVYAQSAQPQQGYAPGPQQGAPAYTQPQPYGTGQSYNAAANQYAVPAVPEVFSTHYTVVSDAGYQDANSLAAEMEARFEWYNRYFRFPVRDLKNRLRVRAFTNSDSYNAYIYDKLKETRAGAVYLHYSQPDRRELVVLRGSPEEWQTLPHQAFLQFFRAFVPYPPSWMREGFAIYFSSLRFDPSTNKIEDEVNLGWLDSLKKLQVNAPWLDSVMLSDGQGGVSVPNFHEISWGLVSFLINAPTGDYFRTLAECFMLLRPEASAPENAQIVYQRIFSWVDEPTFLADFKSYIDGLQTFDDYLRIGQEAYRAKSFSEANLSFEAALERRPTHFAPHYFLGLIAFESNNWASAEDYFLNALSYDTDGAYAGMIYFALGVNSATAGDTAKAIDYLRKAIEASPAGYGERAADIIRRLQ